MKENEKDQALGTNGSLRGLLPKGSSYSCIQMNGKEVFRFAVRVVPQSIELALQKAGLAGSSIDWLLLHQVLYKHKIIIFGGFYDTLREVRYFNDLHVFDLDQFKWQEIKPRPGSLWPSPRSGFQFLVYQDTIYLYGGYSKEVSSSDKKVSEKGIIHSDMWCLDPKTWEWNKASESEWVEASDDEDVEDDSEMEESESEDDDVEESGDEEDTIEVPKFLKITILR